MDVKKAYNQWAVKYDEVLNKTRDLERKVAQITLKQGDYGRIVELGCGTGKNTLWLKDVCDELIGLDFSKAMLQKARGKVKDQHVQFKQQDLLEPWNLPNDATDLVTCSLTLEHIEKMHPVFEQAYDVLKEGGRLYVCEYHPYKQYSGKAARFEKEGKVVQISAFIHHTSEYLDAAKTYGFQLLELKEWMDEDGTQIPRLISFVFRK